MLRIERKAVIADRAAVAVRVVGELPLVAIHAQALQRAEPEGVPIALMWRVVIGDELCGKLGDGVRKAA